MKIQLLFDGGNGASLEKEAYGSFRVTVNDKYKIERVTFGTGFTNNEAEYKTLIAGLEHILTLLDHRGIAPFDVELEICGDSELIRNQIGTYTLEPFTDGKDVIYHWTGWKVNVQHLLPLRDTARGLLWKFYSFDYQHIPRKEVIKVLGH